jgi:hypothetical protein
MRRWFTFVPLPFLLIGAASSPPEDVSFLDLTPAKYYAPHLKVPNIQGENSRQILVEVEDFKKRISKPWRIARGPWPEDATCPEGATLTVIHNLVENGGLAFEFTSSSSGECFFEVTCPRGPSLGAFRVSLGKVDLGTLDTWSPKNEPSKRHRFPTTIRLSPGTHTVRITQESDTDASIFLRSFRLTPTSN